MIAYLALLVPQVILLESFLSFLGLGVQEPLTSLGVLVADGARAHPGRALAAAVPRGAADRDALRADFLGDGLRDALDPRER